MAHERHGDPRRRLVPIHLGDPLCACELRPARSSADAGAAVPVHAAVHGEGPEGPALPAGCGGRRPGRSVSARSAAVTLGKRAIKLGLLAPASLARSREPGLLILGYHRVGAGMEREMDLPRDVFAEQMRHIAEHREVVPLVEGGRRLGFPLEEDLLAVTFDDGYREVFTHAWPVLRELGLSATVFVATGFLDGTDPPPIRAGASDHGAPPEPLTWDQVGELHASGLVTIGSHSRSHRSFDALSRAEAAEECSMSQE